MILCTVSLHSDFQMKRNTSESFEDRISEDQEATNFRQPLEVGLKLAKRPLAVGECYKLLGYHWG